MKKLIFVLIFVIAPALAQTPVGGTCDPTGARVRHTDAGEIMVCSQDVAGNYVWRFPFAEMRASGTIATARALDVDGDGSADISASGSDILLTGAFRSADGNFVWNPALGSGGELTLGTPLNTPGEARLDIETSAAAGYNHGVRIVAGAEGAELLHGYNDEGEHIFKWDSNDGGSAIFSMYGNNEAMRFFFNSRVGDPYAVFGGENGDRVAGNVLTVVGSASAAELQLAPTDTPTACATGVEGRVYYDDSLNELCVCNGSGWTQIDGGGAC